MTRQANDPDFDLAKDLYLAPASDGMLKGPFFNKGHFADFPSSTAMSELAEAGILVRTWDIMQLGVAIQTFQSTPILHYTRKSLEVEQRIADLSSELLELLSEGPGAQDGWRDFWGNADFSDFDETLEPPDPEGTINLPEFCSNLDVLSKSARERLEWLQSGKDSEIEPQSNRAVRMRYFYWLMLIAFWKYQLERKVGTCTSPDTDAYGPLIKLIQVMSAKGMSRKETRGTTIRAFIRRFADRADFFQGYFEPYS